MQAPRTSRASLIKGRSQANAVAQQALIAHWQSIVKSLNNYLKIMRANYVSIRVNNSATDYYYYYYCCYYYYIFTFLFIILVYYHSLLLMIVQVPSFLIRKVFTQIFSFINVQLFNR